MATLNSKQIHIEAIQSIIPGKITDPSRSRRISVDAPLRDDALQSHLRVVFYYANGPGEDESAVAVAGWTKETLSTVLGEHPVLAGRLRREREGEGYWEVKFNDAGVRMVQATAEITMSEFLKLEDREGREGLLAHWMDVDREHPELSALFYIQVTEFQGDGYAIGMSCSLLLADPLFFSQFLKKWAVVHSSMLAQAHPKTPMFHLGYFTRSKKPNHLKSIPLNSAQANPKTSTILFKVPLAKIIYTELASLCVKEATKRLRGTPVSEFSLIISDPTGEPSVKSCKDNNELVHSDVCNDALSAASLDEFGLDEVALSEEAKLVHVSCRVMSCEHQGLVIVMLPAHDDCRAEMLVSATVPMKNSLEA